MNVRTVGIAGSLLLGAFAVACGNATTRSGFGTDTNPTDTADAGKEFGQADPYHSCSSSDADPEADVDGDGYPVKFDCNDCDPNVNAGAFDVPGNNVDDDCNGTVDDDAPTDYDSNIDVETTDPFEGAKAIGLWKKAAADGRDWGVIEAEWVMPDGKPLADEYLIGVGVLPSFGVNTPPAGASMLALSSGYARSPADPGYSLFTDKGYESGAPDGYPKESAACPGVTTGDPNDGASLKLKIRVPSNAKSFSYQQFFFTKEYPTFICSTYNDFFVAMLEPKPAGQDDGNIAFDQDSNPISVNNSLLQVCESATLKGKFFPCPLGNGPLLDTGFEGGGGTGWLTTSAPVNPGAEITLMFSIWDSGDTALDSTVLIDDFKFSLDDAGKAVTAPTGPR